MSVVVVTGDRVCVEQNPDASLHEITAVFDCSTSTICYALKPLAATALPVEIAKS